MYLPIIRLFICWKYTRMTQVSEIESNIMVI